MLRENSGDQLVKLQDSDIKYLPMIDFQFYPTMFSYNIVFKLIYLFSYCFGWDWWRSGNYFMHKFDY